MDDDQIAILAYLNENAVGYENRRSSEEIRIACNFITGGPTNDFVRHKISDIVVNHGICIGSISWDKGYWIIINEIELNRAVHSLESRAQKVLERANLLRINWENSNNG